MKTFMLPDLGEGLQDAEIVSWHVSPGDHVVADQPLAAVETAKAVVEVPAPWSGVVKRLHAKVGDVIAVGAPLVDIETDGAASDPGAVVGDLPEAAAAPEPEPTLPPRRPGVAPARVRATPAVRQQARRMGLDLARITGSGPDGAILTDDLERAGAEDGWEPLRGVRRAMAQSMTAATAVAATTVLDQADVTGWAADADVTVFLALALAAACAAEPGLNAWYDPERAARRIHASIDLGVAMDTADGLFVPVLRDVGARDAAGIRDGLEAMKRDVQARSIPAAELRGQTITLSNFGLIGGRYAALMVVPPQVAILGAGRITDEPAAVDGAVAVRRVLPLSLTFDHRAVTGAEAARFLMAAIRHLEAPQGDPHG